MAKLSSRMAIQTASAEMTKDPVSLEAVLAAVRLGAPTLSLGPASRVRLITRRLWTDVLTSDVTPRVRECFYKSDGGLPSNAETDVRTSDVCSQPSSDKTDSGRASLRVGALTSRVRHTPSEYYRTSIRRSCQLASARNRRPPIQQAAIWRVERFGQSRAESARRRSRSRSIGSRDHRSSPIPSRAAFR